MSVNYTGDAATTRTNLGLGDAATKTTGTSAGNIPVLDGSGNMPAVDGSALTGIEALPSGGTVGQLLTNTASGTGTWQDAAGGGLTEVDHWRLTASVSSDTTFTNNLERSDDSWFAKIGTGMTESSGVFTFPSTGVWKIEYYTTAYIGSNQRYFTPIHLSYNGGSSWDGNYSYTYVNGTGSATDTGSATSIIVNVDNTSNIKVKFGVGGVSSTTVYGSSTLNSTHFMFIKLGEI